MFQYGDNAAIRGMINGRLWLMQSVIVVKDTPQETVLLLAPGAECVYPSGYWRWKRGDTSQGTRWDDAKSMIWDLREFNWHTNRLLIHMVPEQYYATYLMWDDATGEFKCFYINFQTPFQRSEVGFDTLDLELDIVIDPEYAWSIKDEFLFSLGLREGCISKSQHNAVKKAKIKALALIKNHRYPLDNTWVDWRPDPSWAPSRLPEGWENIKISNGIME